MILGYEQPVDIPVMSIYDKQAIRDYVGAVQKDYEEGVKEFNDFRDKYGDFISPIEGASEDYYNTGVGAVMNAYDDYVRRGGDPLRSVEGRAALRKAMNNVDRAKLATIRQSAENAKDYLKAVQNAKKDNNFNPLLEGISIVQSRGEDPSKYSEQDLINIGNNPFSNFDNSKLWDRLGPEQDFDVAEYWKPTLSAVKPETEQEDGYFYTGVTLDKLKNAVSPHLDRFISTGRGFQEYKNAVDEYISKNPGETDPLKIDAGARDILSTQLASPYVTNDAPTPTEATRSRYSRSGGDDGSVGGNNYNTQLPEVNIIWEMNDQSAARISNTGTTFSQLKTDLVKGTGVYSVYKRKYGDKYSAEKAWADQSKNSLPHHDLYVSANGKIVEKNAINGGKRHKIASWQKVDNALLNRAEDGGFLAQAYAQQGLGGLYINKKSGGINFKLSAPAYSPNQLMTKMCGNKATTRRVEDPTKYTHTGHSYMGYSNGAFHRYFRFSKVDDPNDIIWIDGGKVFSPSSAQDRVLQAQNKRNIGFGTATNIPYQTAP